MNSGKVFLVAIVSIAALAIVLLVARAPINNEKKGSVAKSVDPLLELNRTALASTENLEAEQADAAWETLFQKVPDDPSVARNRALNRILVIDDLTETAIDKSAEKSEQGAARLKLIRSLDSVRASIDQFEALADSKVLPMWMRARIDLSEASLLPTSLTKSKRKQTLDTLAKAIEGPLGKDPQSNYLGGSLIAVLEQMEDPIEGLPREILRQAAPSLAALSDAHPENLFFALRAARLNLDNEDRSTVRFVERANVLTQAIKPSIASETRKLGLTPDELVANITTAIQSGDFAEADSGMILWFNVLNSSEIVKTDRRRASPHPLDLLSFDSLRRASAKSVQQSPIAAAKSTPKFRVETIAEDCASHSVHAFDYDLDLDDDLIVTDQKTIKLFANQGDGKFAPALTLQPNDDIDSDITGLIFADLFVVDSSSPGRLRSSGKSVTNRHDTFMTVVAFGDWGARLIAVDGREDTQPADRLTWLQSPSGLEDLKEVTAAVAGDMEADGDLDLAFATKHDGVRMFINRGNRTFFELPSSLSGFGKSDVVRAMEMADLDRDLDLDFVTVHDSGKVGLIENLLHLQFRGRIFDEIAPINGANSIAIEDIDGNVSWDLVIGGQESANVVFSQTADAGAWTIERTQTQQLSAQNMQVADLDNDSWLELIAGAQVCKLGPWGIDEPVSLDGPFPPQSDSPFRSVAADFSGDGLIDLAGTTADTTLLAINETPEAGHYLNVRFKGIDDNVSGRVNHFAVGSVLEARFGPHYRARIVRSPSTHFGIDGIDRASNIRAIFPNGLTQTSRDPKTNSLLEEEQTLKGSCPYLYAWDGQRFAFVTDCLWAAPLGLQVASGVVAKDRPWEYLKIDGSAIQPIGNEYEFRITEELWEVAYFDKIAITAVDHPADMEVWTNEKVGPAEIATPTLFEFQSSTKRTLTSAKDTHGRNVTEQLTNRDRDFVKGFDRRLRQGLCPPHWIDVSFAERDHHASEKTYLVLTGWILPTDTSLNIQIDQNPTLPPVEFPSIWVPDDEATDGWRQAIPFIGFPGGKTKTIVVDVSELAAAGHTQFRVRTSAQIYWDAAELAFSTRTLLSKSQPMELLSAEVAEHGFSKRIKPGANRPETYDYQAASTASRWPPLRGKLTRLGRCTDLVEQWDNRMAVISSGDELRLRFAKPLNDPPSGWVRDFIVHSVGWDKDADLNTLAGQTIGPLPYREMSEYPPLIVNQAKQQKIVDLNAPHRLRRHVFRRFWYRDGGAPPMWPTTK